MSTDSVVSVSMTRAPSTDARFETVLFVLTGGGPNFKKIIGLIAKN